jgi:hypothetical protein
MSAEFHRAVLDCLLPAESDPPPKSKPLPSGAAIGLDLTRYPTVAKPALQLIADAAGGVEAFVTASLDGRIAFIRQVQQDAPATLQALLSAILPDYYESPAVLSALGWRADPPQPAGHALIDMDGATRAALERVRRRGKLWRA